MSVEIRRAEAADLPALLDLYEQLADGFGHRPASLEQAQAWLPEIAAQPGRALLVGLHEGRVAGTVDLLIVSPNLTHAGRPWAIVENVVVDRRARRLGIGRALMEEAVREAREAGCYELQLLSNRVRTEAHAFYRALGFQSSAEGFRLYMP